MMKRPIQKVFAGIAATAVVSMMAVSAYAMSDADFKAQLLEELKVEAKLTAEEIEYVSQKIDDISRDDILASLEEEIEELVDMDLKSQAKTDLDSLKAIIDIDDFFDNLDEIYAYLDEYYEENGDFEGDEWEEEDYDFEEEKVFILEEGKEELQYIEDEDLKAKVSDAIVELEGINDEDLFFDKLDEIYEEIDEYYGYDEEDYDDWDEEEYSFDELKREIIEELGEEEKYIKDEVLNAKVKAAIAELVAEDDEDNFFDLLDALYEDEELEAYYESEGIEILMEDDFFDEDFDFSTEKDEIIAEIQEELSEIDDTVLRSEIESMMTTLSQEDSEHAFFDTLDEIYEKIDSHYGIEWDEEDWEEYEDYDFSSEKEEIIAELQEELEFIEDETLRDQVLRDIRTLESLTDEDTFFDTLDTIYDEVDTYYDENEDFDEWDDEEWDEEDEDEDFGDEEEDNEDEEEEEEEEDDDK